MPTFGAIHPSIRVAPSSIVSGLHLPIGEPPGTHTPAAPHFDRKARSRVYECWQNPRSHLTHSTNSKGPFFLALFCAILPARLPICLQIEEMNKKTNRFTALEPSAPAYTTARQVMHSHGARMKMRRMDEPDRTSSRQSWRCWRFKIGLLARAGRPPLPLQSDR
jgi:hypothetical protein